MTNDGHSRSGQVGLVKWVSCGEGHEQFELLLKNTRLTNLSTCVGVGWGGVASSNEKNQFGPVRSGPIQYSALPLPVSFGLVECTLRSPSLCLQSPVHGIYRGR